MAKRQPTRSSPLRDIARHLIYPTGITSTGWPAVRQKCAEIGVVFDEWQDDAGKAILAKRDDGQYACSIGGAVLSIPRQVGKTFLIAAIIFALCLLNPETKVLWTAHRLRTANETFAKLQAFANRRKVAPFVKQVYLGSGTGEIVFKNGSRILFGARERGFGRGFDDVDVEVFDEAQILTENAIDDMVPATNTAENPLLFFIGTPPKPDDPSEVFTRKRELALSGEDTDTLYVELSADEGCNPLDRKQWAKANPSYPSRTPEAAMLRMHKNLTLESFIREALGVWDEDADNESRLPNWSDLADKDSLIASHTQWALSVSPIELGKQWAAIGKAGRTEDGKLHVEWVEHRAGTRWIVATCLEHYEANGRIPLRVQRTAPEGAFISELREAGVEVVEVSATDAAQATGALIAAAVGEDDDEATEPTLVHIDQPSLNKAVRHAVLRTGPGGAAVWSPKNSAVEITPLIAVTIAAGGVPALIADITQSVW